MVLLAMILCGLVIIVLINKWIFNYWKRRGVKTLTPNFLFGNMTGVIFKKTPFYKIFEKPYQIFSRMGEKCFGFYIFAKPILVVMDPELIKCVFAKDFIYFTDRAFYFNEKVDPLSAHIVSLRGKSWKQMRERLTPIFTPSNLKMMFETFFTVGNRLNEVLNRAAKANESLNFSEIVSKYSTDVTAVSIFGIECNTLEDLNLEIRHFVHKTTGGGFARYTKFFLAYTFPFLLDLFQIPFTDPDIQKFYLNLASQTIKQREKNHIIRKDLMHLLIQIRNNINIENEENQKLIKNSVNKTFTIEQIAAQTLVFFTGGYESATGVITGFVYEVLLNKNVEEKLKDEIDKVLEKHDGEITFNSLMEMVYLDKCVYETMRKYPTVPYLTRNCVKDYVFPETDIKVKKGTLIVIPSFDIHYNPKYYEYPKTFDPERFSAENKAKRPSYTYLPFGEGMRNCMGNRFGMIQVKLALVILFKNYTLSFNPKTQLPMEIKENSLLLKLRNDLIIDIKKRERVKI